MNPAPLLFGIAPTLATLTGGALALALRLRQRIVLVLGITAGVVLGVAVFDLMPEVIELAADDWSARAPVAFVALGLGGYTLLDRALGRASWLPAAWRTHLGPATLTLHSLMDGMGIGIAFQINEGAGWLVAAAVLGVLLGLSVHVPPIMLAPIMAGFTGVFLYIGACELVPRSYALDPRLRTTLASLAGMMLMFVVTSVAH